MSVMKPILTLSWAWACAAPAENATAMATGNRAEREGLLVHVLLPHFHSLHLVSALVVKTWSPGRVETIFR